MGGFAAHVQNHVQLPVSLAVEPGTGVAPDRIFMDEHTGAKERQGMTALMTNSRDEDDVYCWR